MTTAPGALSDSQKLLMRLIVREDGGGLAPLRLPAIASQVPTAARTENTLRDLLQRLREKGLIAVRRKGWVATWAAREIARLDPDAFGIEQDPTAPLFPDDATMGGVKKSMEKLPEKSAGGAINRMS